MRITKLRGIIFALMVLLAKPIAFSKDNAGNCNKAFVYKSDDYAVASIIKICNDVEQLPVGYSARINMPVCDDNLCANVILKFDWDLAGNYIGFDTIPGKPLTKFDHLPFTDADYEKLDQILRNKNSALRVLERNDLIDKSVKIKATTVDAVTGATPKTIKNAVVDGAVYSSYTLWHFVNGTIKDSIRSHTNRIYSEVIAAQLLKSTNYETQLFALKKLTDNDYELHFSQLIQVIDRGVPLIKAYLINKAPLPFQDEEKNRQFVLLFPELDAYSQSIFIDRMIGNQKLANVFLPFMKLQLPILDQKQVDKIQQAAHKYAIAGY